MDLIIVISKILEVLTPLSFLLLEHTSKWAGYRYLPLSHSSGVGTPAKKSTFQIRYVPRRYHNIDGHRFILQDKGILDEHLYRSDSSVSDPFAVRQGYHVDQIRTRVLKISQVRSENLAILAQFV